MTTTRTAAISRIRMLAIDRTIGWQPIEAERLVQAGLDALVAGADTPSLRLLAGLGRNEGAEAGPLFDQVLEELQLLPQLPEDLAGARWEMARWWAGQIVEGALEPARGANLIWQEAACELGYPAALQSVVRWASELDDWHPGFALSRQDLLDAIVSAAADLLDGPWPPSAQS